MNSIVLGIESSCDESAVALYGNDGLLSSKIYTQSSHSQYGGVVPELASRDHLRILPSLVTQVMQDVGLSIEDIQGVAYTAGPGLLGALMVGSVMARSIAWSAKKPSIAINHMEAHLLTPFMLDVNSSANNAKPKFPFLALLVSGGHTMLVLVSGWGEYKIIGESVDDAVGEAFDKTAKILGLGYPGGASLSRLALEGNAQAFSFPRPKVKESPLDFSFSGLKTKVLYVFNELKTKGILDHSVKADIAASFQVACVDSLLIRCEAALKSLSEAGTTCHSLVVSGGVSANSLLRSRLGAVADTFKIDLILPPVELSGDNAAMVAFVGWLRMSSGEISPLEFPVRARWNIEDLDSFEPKFVSSSIRTLKLC